MIGLIQPIALLGLLAIAGPVVVHLLRRRQGRRIVVPSLQLVPRAAQSAVHARQFSDVALMIVRLSIVACACFALAGPLLLTDARLSGWNGRIAKAIVVDQRSAVQVNQLVTEAERASAYVTRDFADVTLSDALRRAGRWLRDAPPAQREVVVLSDFRHGSLTRGDLDGVPPGIGIRFVELREQPATSTTFHGTSILVKGRTWQQTISLDGPRTSVRLTPEGDTDAIKPVRIDAPGDAARRLWNVVMAAGSSLPTGSLVLRFGDPSGGRDTVAADEGKAGARGDAARAALTLLSLRRSPGFRCG